jgi:hypothetical protein
VSVRLLLPLADDIAGFLDALRALTGVNSRRGAPRPPS